MSYLMLFLLLFTIDQLTKLIIRVRMMVGESLPVIKGFLYFTYVQNTGGAFGIMKERTSLFIFVSIIVILGILYFLIRQKKKDFLLKLTFTLVLAGAVSNLLDRLVLGYVVDFLDLQYWPVFNIADSSITVGMIILFFQILFSKEAK